MKHDKTITQLVDELYGIRNQLTVLMWNTHSDLSKVYDEPNTQLRDAKKLGYIAESIELIAEIEHKLRSVK